MNVMNETDLVLHRVNVKLYKNHFRNVQDRYIARTSNEKTLNTTDIAYLYRGKWWDMQIGRLAGVK